MLNGNRQVNEVLKRQKKESDSDGILEPFIVGTEPYNNNIIKYINVNISIC